jgi:hypothetical protein
MLSTLEDVQQMPFRHPFPDLTLELRQTFGRNARGELFQMWRSVSTDAQFAVCGITGVDLFGKTGQFVLESGSKFHPVFGDAEGGAIIRQPRLALRPGQELVAVVGEVLRVHDIEIACLQGVGKMDKDADLKRAPVETGVPPLLDKAPPAL